MLVKHWIKEYFALCSVTINRPKSNFSVELRIVNQEHVVSFAVCFTVSLLYRKSMLPTLYVLLTTYSHLKTIIVQTEILFFLIWLLRTKGFCHFRVTRLCFQFYNIIIYIIITYRYKDFCTIGWNSLSKCSWDFMSTLHSLLISQNKNSNYLH